MTPKKSKDKNVPPPLTPEQVQELEPILDRLGVQDPQGSTLENYLKSLRSLLQGKDAVVAGLLDRLSRRPTAVGHQALLELRGLVESREYRRVLRRAGFRFQQAGFEIDGSLGKPREVALIAGEVRSAAAHAGPLDDDGVWTVSALVPDARHGRVMVVAFLRAPYQCLEILVSESSQRGYREFVEELRRGQLPGVVEIPIGHAARVVYEVLELPGAAAVLRQAQAARQALAPFHDAAHRPLGDELFAPVENLREELRSAAAPEVLNGLVSEHLIFPREELEPFWRRLDDLGHSVLVLSEAVKADRMREIVDEAARAVCSGERRVCYRRFFEERAVFLKLSGADGLARAAWVTAKHLEGGEGSDLNPVIGALVRLSIQAHWVAGEGDGEGSPGGRRGFQRTESGLVIPG
jgi:hypothetical protein